MNDEVANRMLKTLEEPPPFVHLILLTSALGRVLETVVSRCQLVRFDPLSADRLTEEFLGPTESSPARARACARLALGSGERARYLASAEGEALRSEVEALVRHALAGEEAAADEPWRALLDAGRGASRRGRGGRRRGARGAARAGAEGSRAARARAGARGVRQARGQARPHRGARPRARPGGPLVPRSRLHRGGRGRGRARARPPASAGGRGPLARPAPAARPPRSAARRCARRSS